MLSFNFHPFPELATERLLLRRLVKKDVPELFFLRSDPTVLQFVTREPAKDFKAVEDYIDMIDGLIAAGEGILWGIALKEIPGQLIGNICFWNLRPENHRAEIGYVLHPDYWNKGFAKEAIAKVLDYGFQTMQLHSVDAELDPGNVGSAKALESNGFIKEAHLKENICFRGKFLDTLIYSKLSPL